MRLFNQFACFVLFTFPFTVLRAEDVPAEKHVDAIMQGIAKIDSVLATVDGTPVTLRDVILESMQYERNLAGMYSGERLYDEILKLRKKVLDEIIFHRMVYSKYKKNPFEIPKQEIEKRMDSYYERMGFSGRVDFEKNTAKFGITLSELRRKVSEDIAVEIILQQYCLRNVVVTPKQAYTEYVNHPEKWSEPEQVWLQIIQMRYNGGRNSGNMDDAVKRLEQMVIGTDKERFKQIQAEFSDSNDAMESLPIRVSELRPEFREVIKDKNAGFVSGPIKTVEAVYFLRIDKLWNARKKSFSSVSQEIITELRQREGERRIEQFRNELRKNTIVNYHL